MPLKVALCRCFVQGAYGFNVWVHARIFTLNRSFLATQDVFWHVFTSLYGAGELGRLRWRWKSMDECEPAVLRVRGGSALGRHGQGVFD